MVTRSPVAHIGDGTRIYNSKWDGDLRCASLVQRVRAIGRPPQGMLCLFAHMKNVLVMSSQGGWTTKGGPSLLMTDNQEVAHWRPA